MANKNTQNDWDENINTQETPDVRATISIAEDEVLLRDLFGVSLPNNLEADTAEGRRIRRELATTIASRVVNVIDQARTRMTTAQLQPLLNQNIEQALARNRVQVRPTLTPGPLLDTQRMQNVRAVADAIRESVPSAAMNEVLRYGLPAFIPSANVQSHLVLLNDVDLVLSDPDNPRKKPSKVTCDVEIDTRHQFWRRKYELDPRNNPRDQLGNALVDELINKKQTLAALGIRLVQGKNGLPVPENTTISDVKSISRLLKGETEGIDLTKRYEDIIYTDPGPPQVTFQVNTANLIRYRRANGVLVASITNVADLDTWLRTDVNAANFVSVQSNPPGAVVTPAQWLNLSGEIFNRLWSGGANPLAVNRMSLRNIQAQIGEQHHFHATLREGSDNQMGAAFASSILMKYKDIRNIVSVGDPTRIRENLNREKQRIDVAKYLDSLSDLSPNIQFSLAEAAVRRTACNAAYRRVVLGGRLAIGGQFHRIPAPVTPAQQNDALNAARKWIEDREKEVSDTENECRKIANKLRPLAQAIVGINGGTHGTNPSILRLFAPTTFAVIPAEFNENISIPTLLKEIREDANLGLKSTADHEKEVKRLDEELKKIEKGDTPKGEKAQHLVIKEYLKRYQGMTDDEATRGANVIRGRSQLDTETVEHVNYINDALHRDPEEEEILNRSWLVGRGRRDFERIQHVAQAAQIPLRDNNRPAWGNARNYKDLMGAYFALRKMRDGSGVPWMMRLNRTAAVRTELEEITRAILQNHLKAMLQDFGSGLNISDDEQRLILKDPTKPEHSDKLMQMLSGEIPPQHQATVEKILSRADKRTFRYRRNAGNALFGENWGAITGNKLGVSGKNLLYGNKHWSVVGGATGAKNLTVKTTKGLWAKKAPIAKIAALSMLGGPIGLAIGVGLFGKEFSKAKASGSGSSSHH